MQFWQRYILSSSKKPIGKYKNINVWTPVLYIHMYLYVQYLLHNIFLIAYTFKLYIYKPLCPPPPSPGPGQYLSPSPSGLPLLLSVPLLFSARVCHCLCCLPAFLKNNAGSGLSCRPVMVFVFPSYYGASHVMSLCLGVQAGRPIKASCTLL